MTFLSIESPQIWLPLRKLYKKIYTSNWGNSFSVLLIFAIIYFNQFLHTTVWLNYSCQHQIVETSGLYQSLVHFLRMRCEFWRHMAVFAANQGVWQHISTDAIYPIVLWCQNSHHIRIRRKCEPGFTDNCHHCNSQNLTQSNY